jgi:hypothetical protein
MRPVGKVGCEESNGRCAHARGCGLDVETREKDREGMCVCVCVCGKERWRKSRVVRTEATVVRGGQQDQD